MHDNLLGSLGLAESDPDVFEIIGREERRQSGKLIMIASESLTPWPVRQALGSAFSSIYAEGYPARRSDRLPVERLLDQDEQLAYFRRYGDRRFYKGTEFADAIESLAQKRAAEAFATAGRPDADMKIHADDIFVNVQALSGAAANNAVYETLVRPGDTVMGMALNDGGHLSHGSKVNRSGKHYDIVPYGIDRATGRIDYDELARLAIERRPKMIIAGATAYPWHIDWKRLRQIADAVPGGAYLLADISHPPGLVAAGLFPNPIGYADVVTFTTHKTLLGPRAAAILSTDRAIADRIDRAVFPGEQGGPHLHQIAAMAVAFRQARTAEFREIQRRVIFNARALADGLRGRGLALACGGTETHLLLVDLDSVKSESGFPLRGDVASRILDLSGIVCNRNTIPGDLSAGQASGIRLGTVWLTQRGFGVAEMDHVAELIHRVLSGVRPFSYIGARGTLARGKIDFATLREVRHAIAELVDPASADGLETGQPIETAWAASTLEVVGDRAGLFLQEVCAGPVIELAAGEELSTDLLSPAGEVFAEVLVHRLPDDSFGRQRFGLRVDRGNPAEVREWLTALSDGFVSVDAADLLAKIDGPVVIRDGSGRFAGVARPGGERPRIDPSKPFFVGKHSLAGAGIVSKPEFAPASYDGPPRRSALYTEHLKLTTARNLAPFAGYEMPLWYTGIADEHQAVRSAAGLFDVTHMGVLDIGGPGSARFLDLVTTNSVPSLGVGQAQYSYVLDPDGRVLDDVFLYRRGPERFMLVVNAANAERVQSWLEAVNERRCLIDRGSPNTAVDATATIRNLKDPTLGDERLVDVALQGPASREILATLAEPELARSIRGLRKSEFVEGSLQGNPLVVSRTGYTGEDVGFELYVHPDEAPALWRLLLDHGRAFGLKPAGLGARDSTRAEAGFPLWGHELAGPHDVSPAGAGYGSFVKLHKPFFIGRSALVAKEAARQCEIVRFALNERGVHAIRPGDPVLNRRGQVIGEVTSATAVDGRQLGLAWVDSRFATVDTPIGVLPLPRGSRAPAAKVPADLRPGDDYPSPEEARVLPRFWTNKR